MKQKLRGRKWDLALCSCLVTAPRSAWPREFSPGFGTLGNLEAGNAQHILLATSSKAKISVSIHRSTCTPFWPSTPQKSGAACLKLQEQYCNISSDKGFCSSSDTECLTCVERCLAGCISEVMTERKTVTKKDLQGEMRTHCVSKRRRGLGGRFVSGASNRCEIKQWP